MTIGNTVTSFAPTSAARTRAAKAKVLLCVLALGALLVSSAPAQPFPSFLLDTTRYIGRDLHIAGSHVALAGSRTGGMVIWSKGNSRSGPASRLTRSMDVLDTIPLDVTGSLNDFGRAPAVACSDSGYAVAWNGPGGLLLSLMSSTGEVVRHVLIDSEWEMDCLARSVAARSDRYAVVYHVWVASTQRLEIRAAEVGLDGEVLRRAVLMSCDWWSYYVGEPDVARGRAAYLAVFQGPYSSDTTDINAKFVWQDSLPADTMLIPVRQGVHAFNPRIAFDGENFWVAWLEETTPFAETVAKVARVTQSGVVLDTGGIIVSSGVKSIVLAAARETTMVALQLGGSIIVGMRYDVEAQLLDSAPILLSTRAVAGLAVTVATDTFLAVWRDEAEGVSWGTERLAGRRITASGSVVDPEVRDYAFSANACYYKHVAVASDGENFLAVWCDERAEPDYTASLRGRRFDNRGRFLDAAPFTVTDHHANSLWPVLSYGAGCYLLCWHEPDQNESTFGVRISREGEVMDSLPISVSSAAGAHGMAFLPDSLFMVLVHRSAGREPFIVRVKADGLVIDSVPQELRVRWDFIHLWSSVSNVGDTLVMACGMYRNSAYWVAVGFYDSDLRQYDSVWVTPPPGHYPEGTSVACGGGRILVTSERKPHLPIEFYLLDSAGNVLNDSLPLPNPGVDPRYYSLAWDGVNFQCVNTPGSDGASVEGFRISTDGVTLDTARVRLSTCDSASTWGRCALAIDSSGHVGLVFSSFESERYMSKRIRAAVFPRLTGGIESQRPHADLNRLQVGPNPSTGVVWLNLPVPAEEPLTIAIRDIAGRVRSEVSLSPASADRGRTMLDLRQLPAGVYFLETAGERRRCKLVLARPGGAP